MMGIVVPETCWTYKKYNKNNKWHLVGFYSSIMYKLYMTLVTEEFGVELSLCSRLYSGGTDFESYLVCW